MGRGGQGGLGRKGTKGTNVARATSEDLRWRVVWLYYWDEWEKSQVATCLRLSLDTVSRIIERFDSTGGVATWQGVRHAAPHNLKLTTAQELELMNRIIDNPQFMLCEHRNAWEDSTGGSVHLSTICRWIKKVGGSRQKVRGSPRSHRPLVLSR